ncbi:putative N6-adenine methyltransferase-domain-containing protein [Pholiota molesta]|nr:putative N6-adenine methyltransferase-domain-containing protein [Pholiota molesta]
MISIPRSPRSTSTLSNTSGSPPQLDPSTLALLDSHFRAKAEEERLFQEIAAERAAGQIAGLALEVDEAAKEEKPMVSVADFRLAFGEDWQLSQFWYSEKSANKLAKHLHTLCTPSTNIAFLCCPTAFVAFQHMKRLENAKLLEYDQRFAVLSPRQFIPYDIDEPEDVPECLNGTVEIVVADPPFLNEVTNTKLRTTLRKILHPTKGRLILLTSTSVEEILEKLYDAPPYGPLRRTAFDPEHGQLANAFACWGSWEGAEDFGREDL